MLILHGTDTLPIFEAAAREVAGCLPNATLEERPGKGHGASLHNSDAVIRRCWHSSMQRRVEGTQTV
jgi:pimeloyl-ACP methyl ester carboxylesterase